VEALPLYILTSLLCVCPIRPIAAQALWCHNPQRHEISLRSRETSPLLPVSKNTRADIGNCPTDAPDRKSCLGATFKR